MATVIASFGFAIPSSLFNQQLLAPFDALQATTVKELIYDFYQNRYARYFDYDFSVMSKHALSRIYEHYVSLLRVKESAQESFLPTLPQEQFERAYGNIYTPDFIAKFFAKYLRKEVPLSKLQRMRIADPACGSGIFLRTMLETKFETFINTLTTKEMLDSFSLIFGVDIDPNACAAARLSLSLLSLVQTGLVPPKLDIVSGDTMQLFLADPELRESVDVIVTNPPFVNIEELPLERKAPLLEVLGTDAVGKTDLYLGMLSASIDMLRDEGFGCFVLPKNVLISENAAPIREKIARECVLHSMVDLSGVRVFEDVGAYVVLLVFQKVASKSNRPVLVVRCSDLVGTALEDALNDREVRTPAYDVYWSSQPGEGTGLWEFPPPERVALLERMSTLPTLDDVAEVRQGMITGADTIFVVSRTMIPRDEREVYIPFLSDREMTPYRIADQRKSYVFYPFEGGRQLDEQDVRKRYPDMWDYLKKHKEALTRRKAVQSAGNPWWRPVRPREPGMLLRPKIVTPHLVIAPRFSLDIRGEFAVSHSPYIVARGPGREEELLYLLAVLNSTPCFWFIAQLSHKYSKGYSRLEVSTLKKVPIPSPGQIDRRLFMEIVRLVSTRIEVTGERALEIEMVLDARIADAYNMTERDRALVGLGGYK